MKSASGASEHSSPLQILSWRERGREYVISMLRLRQAVFERGRAQVSAVFARQKTLTLFVALVLTGLLGWLDYSTGRELTVSALYLMPICLAGWFAGRVAGLLISLVCVATWLVCDKLSGGVYRYGVIPYWNALMLLVLFVVVVLLLTAVKRVQDGLEATVRHRTAALHAEIAERKRQEIAKLQAERLAAVGTMAAEVAHEVRNPLGVIALNLDLILKEVSSLAAVPSHPPDEARLLVSEMRTEVHRIQHVIEDYLQFARMPKPQKRPMGLNEFLDKKLNFMSGAFEQARVKLRTSFDPTLPSVNADAELLWQATLNLIRNGLDAMAGGGELTVGTWREGGQALLRVTDNGRGMNEEQLSHVFAPFFTTKSEGTGLGLSLVQQIITEHGGHVECESVSGRGSTFTMFLPLAVKQQE